MSGEGVGGSNPAAIVIQTHEDFTEFLRKALSGLDEFERKGKKTFKGLGAEAADFIKTAFGGALLSAGKDFAEVVSEPINTSFKRATDDARAFRQENTRLALATGQDWRQLGTELDDLAKKTHRPQEQLRGYMEGVKDLTGNWKTAKDGVETYGKLATYLGKRSAEELAPLAAEMENTFGVKGKSASEEFFNSLIAKADKLGQSGQMAVAIWQRVAGSVGKEATRGPQGAQIAAKDAAMIPALSKMGYSPEESEQILGKFSGLFSGDLQWMERHMRSQGQLGKKEKLRDKYGRLSHSLPDLIARLYRTELGRVGGSKERLHQRVTQDQNLGPLAGGFLDNLEEFAGIYKEGQNAPTPDALGAVKLQNDDTPEGRRQFEELLRKEKDRKEVGEPTLKKQDDVSTVAPGGTKGLVQGYGLRGIGIAGALRAGEAVLSRFGFGRAASAIGRGNPLLALASTLTMSGDSSVEAPKSHADYFSRMTPAQRTVALTAELEGMRGQGGKGAYGGYAEVLQAANPQLTKQQADATAKALKEGAPVPVVLRMLPPPIIGGGAQVH